MIKDIFINTIREDKSLKIVQNKKETGSFVELFGLPKVQSFSIKLGNTIEECFRNYVLDKGIVLSKGSIDGHQIDLFFEYEDEKYYFEIKNNVNMDTEKTIAVAKKIEDLWEYADIVGCLSFRKATGEELAKFAKPPLVPYIYGYNDFFNIFGESLPDSDFQEIIEEMLVVLRGRDVTDL